MMRSWKPIISIPVLKKWFEKGFSVPLIREVPFKRNLWQTFLKTTNSDARFFLDSGKYRSKNARFSYFGDHPFLILRKKGTKVQGRGLRPRSLELLPVLRKLFQKYKSPTFPNIPFATGGAFGYLGYALAWEFEKLPKTKKPKNPFDDSIFLFTKSFFVFDHTKSKLYLVSNLIPEKRIRFEKALDEAKKWIDAKQYLVGRSNPPWSSGSAQGPTPTHAIGNFRIHNFQSDVSKKTFKQMVERAKGYIEAGDIYQANLSQRFSFSFEGNPEKLYEKLRSINPSPFASFFQMDDTVIISSSPERLVSKRGYRVETRPIAGTRPKGKTLKKNQVLRRELLRNMKERAEHIMLVDLERNDLGRVCKPHTVRVSEMMGLEEYSHVIHIVSNVIGEMDPKKDQFDLIRAMFPGGTITGCPKVRCMEIIEELEPFPRGLYTGSLGYFGFNGDLDFNIVIRTILLKREKGYFQVGAGIVYDSNPEAEFEETLHKGQALKEALL